MTATAENNTRRVQDLYSAFGMGDIPTIIEAVSDEVEWIIPGPTDIPWKGIRHGKQAVQEWFGLFGQNLEFKVFEPREFIAQRDKVVVLVHSESIVRRTGREIVNPEVHIWTFEDNMLSRFQIYEATNVVASAYYGT